MCAAGKGVRVVLPLLQVPTVLECAAQSDSTRHHVTSHQHEILVPPPSFRARLRSLRSSSKDVKCSETLIQPSKSPEFSAQIQTCSTKSLSCGCVLGICRGSLQVFWHIGNDTRSNRLTKSTVISQLRREPRDSENDKQRPDSTRNDRHDRSEEIRHKTGFERAQFIGGSNKQRVQSGDPAAHIVWSEGLNERGADDDTDVVTRSQQAKHCQREPETVRDAENRGHDSET